MSIKELIDKYPDVKLKFESYYKYTFMYEGETEDGLSISADVGGSADDIYRVDVVADQELTLAQLCPNTITVTKNRETIEAAYDY